MRTKHTVFTGIFTAAIATVALVPAVAGAAVGVTQFSLTPSTLQAGGHPSIYFTAGFVGADANVGLKDLALHLPPGLRVRTNVAKRCSSRLLIRNDCPTASKVGQVKVSGSAFGTPATITRDIYNLRPFGGQQARLGAIALPGIPVALPVTQRPDGGLDLVISGLPQIGGAITAQLDRIEIRIKSKIGRRSLLTNPATCLPALTTLDLGFRDPATPRVTAASAFTPTGC